MTNIIAPDSLAASLLPTPPVILNDDDHFEFFWETVSPFSQWKKSEMVIDGVVYPTAESFQMAEKARQAKDHVMLAKILATNNPRDVKALGREIQGFVEEDWVKIREDVIYRGNLAKFQQNVEFCKILLETGDREIIEAAPSDFVYGIGITATKARITPRDQWPGLNLLGIALMRVRSELRAAR